MADEGNTRRLAAILAADVVDYSRLMHEDEAGTVAAWQSARRDAVDPILEANKGRVVKRTGDGFLAEFATVEDAVRCAVAMQAALAESALAFRMGINLGDITDDGDDIHGDGVNIAARLEGLADPGGIYISGSVHDQVHNKLDLAFTDMGERQVKNIARPVRAFKVNMGETKAASVTAPPKPNAKSRIAIAASIAAVIAVAAGLFIWEPWVKRVEPASVAKMAFKLPEKPSIAVLPFNDFSEKKDQGFFADGLTEEIISNLASFENIFVIARNSTNKFKGKSVDVRSVAEDLGVRYVLEGSIRRAGDDIRVTAQLIDAINGRHIWANKYDRQMKDIFALQDEITGEIASRLVSKVAVAEFNQRSRKQTNSPEAYTLFLQGWAAYNRVSRENNQRAIRLFEQAIAKDPNYGRAYAVLAIARRANYMLRWGRTPKDTLDHALELAQKGVQLSPRDVIALKSFGDIQRLLGHHKKSLATAEKAVRLAPGDANALMSYALSLTYSERAEDAVQAANTALRLEPFPRFSLPLTMGVVFYQAKRYEAAAAALKRARTISPRSPAQPLMLAAAAYAQLGRMEEARAAREDFLKLNPNYAISGNRHLATYPPKLRKHAEEGLRKAGFPENPPLKLPDKPSVAVLPFVNMSSDKDQEYFSDGITEDIITDLSKISGLFVIARTSTNRYKGKSVDVRQIARELGVRYIVEGSVRKADGKVRITAQLISASTGNHAWAERYDRKLEDVFAIQDEVTKHIVSALAVTLKAGELAKLERIHTLNVEAREMFQKGVDGYSPPTKVNLARSREAFRRAIELDPNYAGGYAGLAWISGLGVLFGKPPNPERLSKYSLNMARKALALDKDFAWSYMALAYAYFPLGKFDKAIEAVRRGIEVEPGRAQAHAYLGLFKTFGGLANEAIGHIKTAIRLSPTSNGPYLNFLGFAYFYAKRYKDAVAAFEANAARRGPMINVNMAHWAASYAMIGQIKKGKEIVARILETYPGISLSNWPAHRLFTEPYKNPKDRETLAAALRLIGFPE